MAYDEVLAARVAELLGDLPDVRSQKMFGGLGFMVGGHMAVAVASGGDLMVRVDPGEADAWLDEPGVRPMEMHGRQMRGWLVVSIAAVATDEELDRWLRRGVSRACSPDVR
ncbi:hypothetical protein I601_2892 [Nocardioides dokdonensis FR1436]|uniref:TfoX N-terminal domain-containing protein n=1 Tax=Nocardioides dokdonensis FR1436 TaxID=1300347 RepID=A0A1A9GM04_9ACTN|nr:TfoX/Sxy family protein [Nocardioides dokdonensis]ANH39308.1 hypothetical protein I601_2892 [Nocardioides dokdonensis FR1436]